jgi:hypothetical protein
VVDQPSQREAVRVALYESFRRTGHVDVAALTAQTALSSALVADALRDLHASRDVVLDIDGSVVMAHPFSSGPLGFSVMSDSVLWWGGCAWDSFAIPHLLPEVSEALVATTCPGCGSALAWVVTDRQPPNGSEVAHFLTPTAHIWDDVVRSCANQRLFCSEDCVDQWFEQTGHVRGYVMDLPTLWRLAQGWYVGRLDAGYQRREPTEAVEYFASVGLRGPFWGLPK